MSSRPDPLPCPFCGSDDITIQLLAEAEVAYACNHCLTVGPVAGSEDDADELWNERHDGVDPNQW